jgi:heavy metal translocating P-type ATPase
MAGERGRKMSASIWEQQKIAIKPSSKWTILSYSQETYIAIFALIGVLLYLILQYLFKTPPFIIWLPLLATLIVGGIPLLFALSRKLLAGEFGSDLLAGISIITSILLGEYLVGAIIVLMLSGGAALEQYATRRASSILDALARRMPTIAHRKLESRVEEILLDQIVVGETLVVLPHELCPVDGVVIEGRGLMDESYLTGEPYEISKVPGSQVLSGAVNGDSALTISATELPVDSRYAKIMQVIQDAEQKRPRLRRLGDRLGAWYTPLALVVAALGWIITGNPDRFLAVIVIATPCPLLIGIPVAVIGAISLAAKRGIIIKNPAILEQVDTCRTLIFDKTGTLTYGKPSVTEILCAPGFDSADVLRMAASLEQYSKHPLASAILTSARKANLRLQPVSQINEKPGKGLNGIIREKRIQITGRGALADQGLLQTANLPPTAAGLECLIFVDGVYAAALRFHDEPRHESGPFVNHLTPRHGVDKVILLSGDRESEVRYLAGRIGIADAHSGKSPEEKVEIVAAETKCGGTLFVGDGINDAPAMQAATVGVAFGQNSDITAEAADVVMLDASLRKVDELMHIGRRMRMIALQSAIGGIALSLIGMIVAAAGYLPPVAGAIAQEIIDVAAVLNAVRVALPLEDLTDF